MHAPPKSKYPVADPSTLEKYDAFLFGIPTRYGNFPAQWKTFWDAAGKQWGSGAFWGKYAGLFISSGTVGGGQESTAISAMSTLTHHGIIYVPLGYKTAFPILANLTEVRGGSPWGAGTFAVSLFALLTQGSYLTPFREPMDLGSQVLSKSSLPLFRGSPLAMPSRKSAFKCNAVH
jgi:multimeric flavodoxin WrbA